MLPAPLQTPKYWLPALAAALTLLLAWPTLDLGFALDDQAVLQENAYVYQAQWGRILRSAYWQGKTQGGPDYYRPLSLLSFALEAKLSGHSLRTLHSVHLLSAALASATVAWTLLTWLPRRPWVAGAATALWMVHPLHAEVLCNLKSRDELYAVIFGMSALALAHRARPWAAGLCFLLALLSKESALTLILALPMALWVFSERSPRQILRAMRPFALALWLWACLRLQATGTLLPDHPAGIDVISNNLLFGAAGPSQRWGTTLSLFGLSAKLLVWPHPLISDYSIGQLPLVGLGSPRAWLSGLLLTALVLPTAWAASRQRGHWTQLPAFCVAWAAVTWITASNTLSLVRGAALADRYLFLPSLGLCLGVALALDHLRTRQLPRHLAPAAAWLTLLTLLTLGAWRTQARIPDWQDSQTLFAADLPKAPGNPRLVAHFLTVQREQARPGDAALKQSTLASLEPTMLRVESEPARYEHTAVALYKGLTTLCIALQDRSCTLQYAQAYTSAAPLSPQAWFLAAEAAFHMQDYAQSQQDFERAWALKQGSAAPDLQARVDYPTNLCVAAWRAGDRDAARAACLQATEISPGHRPALNVLALLEAPR